MIFFLTGFLLASALSSCPPKKEEELEGGDYEDNKNKPPPPPPRPVLARQRAARGDMTAEERREVDEYNRRQRDRARNVPRGGSNVDEEAAAIEAAQPASMLHEGLRFGVEDQNERNRLVERWRQQQQQQQQQQQEQRRRREDEAALDTGGFS